MERIKVGDRGPAATPTAILRKRGSWLANVNKNEPLPQMGVPSMPDWLPQEAKEVWGEITPMLDYMGVLAKIDGPSLVRYCSMWKYWKECADFVEENGMTFLIKDKAGNIKDVKTFPQAKMYLSLTEKMLKIEVQFGMTPSARTRIETNALPAKDEGKSRFLKIN